MECQCQKLAEYGLKSLRKNLVFESAEDHLMQIVFFFYFFFFFVQLLSGIEHRSTSVAIWLAEVLQLAPYIGDATVDLVLPQRNTAPTHQQLRLGAEVFSGRQQG